MVSEPNMNAIASLSRLAGRPLARMNGVGNAIVVLDLRGVDLVVTVEEARAIAMAPGLAFDQLMVIHDPREAGTDAFLRIHNIDGSLSGACGNGTRCVAWFLLRQGPRDSLVLATSSARLACRRLGPTTFSVDMGPPSFAWHEIPLRDAGLDPRAVDIPDAATFGPAFALSMGNPHAIFFVADTEAIDLGRAGPSIEHAAVFPERVNVSFAEIIDRETIKLRVWERGAGATLGCGSGACAAVVAAASTGRTERAVRVDLPGGRLHIEWRADGRVIMTGPVEFEFETALANLGERAA